MTTAAAMRISPRSRALDSAAEATAALRQASVSAALAWRVSDEVWTGRGWPSSWSAPEPNDRPRAPVAETCTCGGRSGPQSGKLVDTSPRPSRDPILSSPSDPSWVSSYSGPRFALAQRLGRTVSSSARSGLSGRERSSRPRPPVGGDKRGQGM